MSEWKEYKLGDISEDVSYGYTESANDKPVGPKFLRITDIREGSIDWDKVPYCVISEKDFIKNKIEIGDIVIARTGATTGITETIKHNVNAVFASYLIRFRINKLYANPFYVGYILKSNLWKDYVSSIVGGSAQPGANAKQFSDFTLKLPNLRIQNTITEILSSLDDKIELNNKINQELENLAQTLFKQWFIDFEFPDEKGEPYKSSGGEMVDSELGEIPEGWEVGKFGDLVDIINGYAFKSKDFNFISNEGILKIRNINGIVVDIVNTDFVSSEVVRKLNNKFKVQAGDILIAMTGAEVGKIGITPESDKSLWLNQRVGKVVPKNKEQISFIHTMFNVLNLTEVVRNEAMGSAQPNISSQGIEKIKLLIPSINLIDEYSSMFIKKYELFYKSLKENQELVDLRDTLLPKLISGELEINEISK